MYRFSVSRKFNCDSNSLWLKVKDIDSVTKYWRGLRSVKKIQGDLFEVRFAFPASGIVNIKAEEEARTLTFTYIKGPFRGTNEVHVGDGEITSSWEVEFNGLYKLIARSNVQHFSTGASHALQRLVEECGSD
ncbi:hypothetical protein HS1genome_1254 [Sulfodiicoccus acidiphilus]|uniref:SRPBCC family protein n=1 Tax=Sulfodiicoccus acidiphilus TaxID=1670455 RepID=A0A348B3W3_9CREN|nr:SRPBCC family protein [Sulfodiicoccus acidiphilus]BBD72865.1 hypothetical protein HS1genome_1254 [Sulfodiicoccus acidiphilus]GGT88389.1 hypothetical protein GCM10007116_02980 [Sulfodiicoccus acidiphilus]